MNSTKSILPCKKCEAKKYVVITTVNRRYFPSGTGKHVLVECLNCGNCSDRWTDRTFAIRDWNMINRV